MATKYYIRRGTLAELKTIKLNANEFGFTTDTKQVFVGDGQKNYPISVVMEGNIAERPAAGNPGMVFIARDESDAVYFDAGTAWIRPALIDDSSNSPTATWSGKKIAEEIASARLGIDQKESVRVATTSAIDLTTGGLLEIDGVTVAAGDRVLVKDQEDATENGIYVAAESAWTRSEDADGKDHKGVNGEVSTGMSCYVEEGDANAGSTFVMNAPGGSKSVGTDELVFVLGARLGELTGGDGIDVSGGKISAKLDGVSLKLNDQGQMYVDVIDGGTFV